MTRPLKKRGDIGTTINISSPIHAKAKKYCDDNEYFLGGWIAETLKKALDEIEKDKK